MLVLSETISRIQVEFFLVTQYYDTHFVTISVENKGGPSKEGSLYLLLAVVNDACQCTHTTLSKLLLEVGSSKLYFFSCSSLDVLSHVTTEEQKWS